MRNSRFESQFDLKIPFVSPTMPRKVCVGVTLSPRLRAIVSEDCAPWLEEGSNKKCLELGYLTNDQLVALNAFLKSKSRSSLGGGDDRGDSEDAHVLADPLKDVGFALHFVEKNDSGRTDEEVGGYAACRIL